MMRYYKRTSFWIMITLVITIIVVCIILVSKPTRNYGIYNHPATYLSEKSLQSPGKMRIVDHINNEEYMLTNREDMDYIANVIKDIRLAEKELSRERSITPGRYSISYYDNIDRAITDYKYTIHLDPLWIDNMIKPSYRLELINSDEILDRINQFFRNKAGDYDFLIDELISNKTPYIGNHIRVGTLLDALPAPEGIRIGMISMQTKDEPYGLTVNYFVQEEMSNIDIKQWTANGIMLFALIENMDVIDFMFTLPVVETASDNGITSDELIASVNMTRDMADDIIGKDVRIYAVDSNSLAELADLIGAYFKVNPDYESKEVGAIIHDSPLLEEEDIQLENEFYHEPVDDKINLLISPTEFDTRNRYYFIPDHQTELYNLMDELQWTEITSFPEDAYRIGITVVRGNESFDMISTGALYYYLEDGLDYQGFISEHSEFYYEILNILWNEINYAPFVPTEITDIIAAEVIYKEYNSNTTYQQRITDPKFLQIIEETFHNAEPLGEISACSFDEAIMTLHKMDGSSIQVRLATDSCPIYFANGNCFEYGGEVSVIHSLFYEILWR